MLVIWQIHLVSLVKIILFGNPVGGRPYFCLCTYSARASIIHKRCHPFQGTTHYLLAILIQGDVENHCTNYPVQHFFCNSSSLPVWASLLQNGWYCVTIFVYKEGQSLCDNIFCLWDESCATIFFWWCWEWQGEVFGNLLQLFQALLLAFARFCKPARALLGSCQTLLPFPALARFFPTFPSSLAVRRASFRNPSIAACLSYVFQLFLGNCWFLFISQEGITIGVCSLKALR